MGSEPSDNELLARKLANSMEENKAIIDELEIMRKDIAIKNRTIKLLLVAGHLDEVRLEQATELAGGIY